MSTRIEIELTSSLDENTWTWRAAGAKLPKGVLSSSLLPDGSKVGDVLRADADMHMDGTEIVHVLPPKGERAQPELLEILGSGKPTDLVTTQLAPKGKGGRGRDRDGGRGRDRKGGGKRDGRRGEGRGDRGPRNDSDGDGRRERRPRRDSKPEEPARPKPKRLRPRRDHRTAVLAELPEEHRPIADQVLRGGVPAVRKAIEEQNAKNKAENLPEIDAAPLERLAEEMLPGLKAAEWQDRADAALAGIDEVDLRDLRSVVVAAESGARSEEARALAEQLRTAVAARVDNEHTSWLGDITTALEEDRVVRALRMSSRPPKAGAPLPPDLAKRLSDAAAASLSAEITQQRYGTVLDAISYSPVRSQVTPASVPEKPTEELLSTIRKVSTRVPEIAALFGIEPTAPPKRERRRRGSGGGGGGGKAKGGDQTKSAPKAKPAKDKPAEATTAPEAAAAPAEAVAAEAAPAPVEAASPEAAAAAEAAAAPAEAVAAEAAPAEAAPTEAETAAPVEAAAEAAPAEAEAAAPVEAAAASEEE